MMATEVVDGQRVVVTAVDASDNARDAFDCTYIHKSVANIAIRLRHNSMRLRCVDLKLAAAIIICSPAPMWLFQFRHFSIVHCVPKIHVTTFYTITLTISAPKWVPNGLRVTSPKGHCSEGFMVAINYGS